MLILSAFWYIHRIACSARASLCHRLVKLVIMTLKANYVCGSHRRNQKTNEFKKASHNISSHFHLCHLNQFSALESVQNINWLSLSPHPQEWSLLSRTVLWGQYLPTEGIGNKVIIETVARKLSQRQGQKNKVIRVSCVNLMGLNCNLWLESDRGWFIEEKWVWDDSWACVVGCNIEKTTDKSSICCVCRDFAKNQLEWLALPIMCHMSRIIFMLVME